MPSRGPTASVIAPTAYFQLGQPEAAAKALGEARKLGFKPDQLGALERRDYQQLAAKLGG